MVFGKVLRIIGCIYSVTRYGARGDANGASVRFASEYRMDHALFFRTLKLK